RRVPAGDARWEQPHRCAYDDTHRVRKTCALLQRAGERTEGRRYRRYLHRDRPRHRQMALVRRNEPASRQLSREERCSAEAERSDTDGSFNAYVTLFLTLGSYT